MGRAEMAAELRRVEIADVGAALLLLAEVYTDARRALAEYVSNSADAFAVAERAGRRRDWRCTVRLTTRGMTLAATVSDNAAGVSHAELLELPGRVTLSSKRGDLVTKGHKAIGLLAFASFCRRMTIVSRADGTLDTYRAEWSVDCLRAPEKHPVLVERVTPRKSPGTDIILEGVESDRHHQLKKQRLVEFFRVEFAPDLRDRRYELTVEDADGAARVEPSQYSGVRFSVLRVTDRAGAPIELDLYLAQRPAMCRVSLFVRGKQVVEDLGTLPEFAHSPWTSGRIAGEIRCDYLRPITGRAGGVEGGPAWERFVAAVRQLEDQLEAELKRIAEEQRSRQAHRLFKELNQALSAVLPKLRWEELPHSAIGGTASGAVASPGDGGVGPAGSDRSGTNGGQRPGDPHRPRTSRLVDPSRTRAVDGRPSPGFNWREVEFEADGRHLRSRFVSSTALIEINSAHDDYLLEREDEARHRQYLLRLASKEVTVANFAGTGDREVTERMVELETALSRYLSK